MYDKYGKAIGTYEAGTDADAENGLLTLNVMDANGNQTDTVLKPERRSDGYYVGEASIRQSTEYNAAGKETAAIDALGHRTSYGYD